MEGYGGKSEGLKSVRIVKNKTYNYCEYKDIFLSRTPLRKPYFFGQAGVFVFH